MRGLSAPPPQTPFSTQLTSCLLPLPLSLLFLKIFFSTDQGSLRCTEASTALYSTVPSVQHCTVRVRDSPGALWATPWGAAGAGVGVGAVEKVQLPFAVRGAPLHPGTLQEVWYSTVLYCTVLYCTALYCTLLYCTVLYSLYCTVLYCTALTDWQGLYCRGTDCRVPCCTLICCVALRMHFNVLCSTVLLHAAMQCVALYGAAVHNVQYLTVVMYRIFEVVLGGGYVQAERRRSPVRAPRQHPRPQAARTGTCSPRSCTGRDGTEWPGTASRYASPPSLPHSPTVSHCKQLHQSMSYCNVPGFSDKGKGGGGNIIIIIITLPPSNKLTDPILLWSVTAGALLLWLVQPSSSTSRTPPCPWTSTSLPTTLGTCLPSTLSSPCAFPPTSSSR